MSQARVWRFDGVSAPEELYLTDEAVPAPGPGEAQVELRAIGLNRADLLFMAGHYLKQPESPSTLGLEAVGEVVAVGPPGGASPPGGFEPKVGERVGLLAMARRLRWGGDLPHGGQLPTGGPPPRAGRLHRHRGARRCG